MKRYMKWAGMGLLGALGVIVLLVGVLYGWSSHRLGKLYQVAPAAVMIRMDDAAVKYGEHLLKTRGCHDCHGQDLGGAVFIEDAALGKLYAPNLTRGQGGVGAVYDDSDWVRSIRHGVAPGGRALLFMPSYEYHPMDADDLGALIAYLKSLEPVDRELPRSSIGPLGRALFLAGELPLLSAEMIDHTAPVPPAPPRAATAEYGRYIGVTCVGCHGQGYSGGRIPGAPPVWPTAANITPHETGLGDWTFEQFETVMRTGVRPDGRQIEPEFMPWTNFAHLTDEELEAVWLYLQTLDPRPVGGR
jgi:mono/diheme cytochrome c family protein